MRLLRQITRRIYVALALSSVLMFVTSACAQYPWPQHTPLIDGDDVLGDNSLYSCAQGNTLYKCQYKGFLYGHWNSGSNTPQTAEQVRHDTDGRNIAPTIVAKCPPFDSDCTHGH